MGLLCSSRVRRGGVAFWMQAGWDYGSSSVSCCFYKAVSEGDHVIDGSFTGGSMELTAKGTATVFSCNIIPTFSKEPNKSLTNIWTVFFFSFLPQIKCSSQCSSMLWCLHPCVPMSSSSNRQLIRLHFTQIPNIVETWLSSLLITRSLCTDTVRACCTVLLKEVPSAPESSTLGD